MATLFITTSTKKQVLLQAVTAINTLYKDQIERVRFLCDVSRARQAVDFTNALKGALAMQQAPGLFLEYFEACIVREGLELIKGSVSEEVVKQTILNSRTSWGSIDTEKLASNLTDLVNNTVETRKVIDEMLDELNDGPSYDEEEDFDIFDD